MSLHMAILQLAVSLFTGRQRPVSLPAPPAEPTAPPVTEEMRRKGFTWVLATRPGKTVPEVHWIKACDFCGGNCGQCGNTSELGNIGFDFKRVVHNATKGE